MTQSYLKMSIDGPNGSGKSGTAMRLAVGIAIEYGNGAPIVGFDSEERMRFLKVSICELEGIQLIVVPGKSLVTLRDAQAQAVRAKASVFLGDQLTTPWMEGLKTFSYENGNLPFDRRQQLMNEWEPVVDNFRYGPYHAICCGRQGFHWANVEDPETGDTKLVQGDPKFNAGGGNNFGYEAELELEMRRRKRSLLGMFRGKTSVEYVCDVIKDAAGGLLNGKQFVFPASDGPYRKGDYKPILDAFRPYIEFMRKVEAPEPRNSTSEALIVSGKTAWGKDQAERKNHLEELEGNLKQCFPGGEGKSKLAEMFTRLTLEFLNGFVSWSRMAEYSADEPHSYTDHIERNVFIVRALRRRIEQGAIPTDQDSLKTVLTLALNDVEIPEVANMTLYEVMKWMKEQKKGAPQPITKVLDMPVRDEVDVAGD